MSILNYKKLADERSFLPAAVELEQTPPRPMGRAIVYVICLLFVLAAIWAWYGKIDVVAVAQGKLIPSDRIKTIQPLEAGTIRAIHIKEGQLVEQGDTLITLDNTQAQADADRLAKELTAAKTNLARLEKLDALMQQQFSEKGITNKKDTLNQTNANLLTRDNDNTQTLSNRLLQQQVEEFQARYQTLISERERTQAEVRMAQGEVEKLKLTMPILKERVDALEQLHAKNYSSKLEYLELKQQYIEEEQNIKIERARVSQIKANQSAIEEQINILRSEQQRIILDELQQTRLQVAALEQELIKASQRNRMTNLNAPITGTVQQLQVHTVGGVVTPAQELMVIVPQDTQLEAEAFILNKDIGFVNEGQSAEVKIDTFNFTKYGVIDAEVIDISNDAISDENLGLVYAARVKLKHTQMRVNDKLVNLTPGMSVAVEVKTGTRRLIEYFLSPLLRYKQESIRER